MLCAFSKEYNTLCGNVIETFSDRVKVDRVWLYGTEDKKLVNNVFMLDSVILREIDDAEFQKEADKVKVKWDQHMDQVLAAREEWKKTWTIR